MKLYCNQKKRFLQVCLLLGGIIVIINPVTIDAAPVKKPVMASKSRTVSGRNPATKKVSPAVSSKPGAPRRTVVPRPTPVKKIVEPVSENKLIVQSLESRIASQDETISLLEQQIAKFKSESKNKVLVIERLQKEVEDLTQELENLEQQEQPREQVEQQEEKTEIKESKPVDPATVCADLIKQKNEAVTNLALEQAQHHAKTTQLEARITECTQAVTNERTVSLEHAKQIGNLEHKLTVLIEKNSILENQNNQLNTILKRIKAELHTVLSAEKAMQSTGMFTGQTANIKKFEELRDAFLKNLGTLLSQAQSKESAAPPAVQPQPESPTP